MSSEAAATAPVTASTSDVPKIVVYWLEQSRSQRILWLLEALNLPYEVKIYHRDPKTHLAPPELKEVHPLGKSPVISIQPAGSQPIVIAESGLITEYILEHFGKGTTLLPTQWKAGQEGKVGGETEGWLRYRYFLHYAEGSLMTLMLLGLFTTQIKDSPVPFFIKPVTGRIAGRLEEFLDPNFKTHFEFLESQLRTSPNNGKYLCGENLTGADILMSFPLIGAKLRAGITKEGFPLLASYIDMLERDESYKRAVKKIEELDGKFEAMLKL